MINFELAGLREDIVGRPLPYSVLNDYELQEGFYARDYQYVYRCDHISPDRGREKLLISGYCYNNLLGNVRNLAAIRLPYLIEIINEIAIIDNKKGLARGLYFWPSLNLAKRFQLKCIANQMIDVHMDLQRKDVADRPNHVASMPFISRVPISVLPPGKFFDDPNWQYQPFGMLHLTDSFGFDPLYIPSNNIEFLIDGVWCRSGDVKIDAIIAQLELGNYTSIVPPVDARFLVPNT